MILYTAHLFQNSPKQVLKNSELRKALPSKGKLNSTLFRFQSKAKLAQFLQELNSSREKSCLDQNRGKEPRSLFNSILLSRKPHLALEVKFQKS